MNLALWKSRFGEYLQSRNYARRSIESYTGELLHFFGFLESCGIQTLSAVTREVVEDYRSHLLRRTYRGKRITAQTQGHCLGMVKAFLHFLHRAQFIAFDPSVGVEPPKKPKTLPRNILSEQETERVLEAASGDDPLDIRNRAILEVLYCTAIRNQELRDLQLDHLDLENRELRVEHGKGAKGRMLPLGEDAVYWLREYLRRARPHLVAGTEQRLVFVTLQGRRFTRSNLAWLVRHIAKKAGIKKVVTPHVLRHACATHMLERGAGLRQLQELMGHESPQATQRYTRVVMTNLRRVLQRCHPRERRGS